MVADNYSFQGWTMARASIENPSVSLNDPAALEEVWGFKKSAAGIRVGPKDALGYAPVWQAVTMIASKVAELPLHVYKRKAGEAREIDRKHKAAKLANRQFNRFPMSSYRGWRLAMVQALIWNNAYLFVDRSMSDYGPIGLYHLNPSTTKPALLNGRIVYTTQAKDDNGTFQEKLIEGRDVIHVSGIEFMPAEPLELIKLARNSIGTGLAAERYTSRYFSNGVKPGGILMVPPGVSKTYVENLEKNLQEGYTRENEWFKTAVLRDGVKFESWATSPSDAEMTPTRTEQVRDVARYFNLQPSRLGLQDSVSYNSKAEDNRAFLETTLAPWLRSITSECDLKLLSQPQIDRDTHYFEHNTRKLLNMDYKTRVQVGAMGTKAGLFTRNEWRAGENLPSIEGGDELPTLGKQADMSGVNKGENDKPRGPSNDDVDTEQDQQSKNSLRRMTFELCSRARHKSQDHRAYATWLNANFDAATAPFNCTTEQKHHIKETLMQAMDSPVSELANTVESITYQLEESV